MKRSLRDLLPGGEFGSVAAGNSRRMKAIRGHRNRSTELRLRLGLVRSGLTDWRVNPVEVHGKPDFLFPDANLAVFVDGCFWHGCERCSHAFKTNKPYWSAKISGNIRRDQAVTEALEAEGTHVLRLWEHQLADDLGGCIRWLVELRQRYREGGNRGT